MSAATGTLKATRAMYEQSGESLAVLRVIIAGAQSSLRRVQTATQAMTPSDRPKKFSLDLNRMIARLDVYRADLTGDVGEGMQQEVAANLFRRYTRGRIVLDPDEAQDLGLGGTYTPTTRPEMWKVGSLLGQAWQLGLVSGPSAASAAWEDLSGTIREAARAVVATVGGTAIAQWFDEQIQDVADLATRTVSGLAATIIAVAAAVVGYQATKRR